MATVTSYNAYETAVSVLSGASELNSLAHGSLGAVSGAGSGTILDNTSLLDIYADFELDVGTLGSAPLATAWFRLYMWTSLDATNYEFSPAAGAFFPDGIADDHKVGDFFIPNGFSTTGKLHIRGVQMRAGKAKFQLYNLSGVALPSSGAVVKCFRYNIKNT